METTNCHCHVIVGKPAPLSTSKSTSKRTSSTKKKNQAFLKNKDELQIHISQPIDSKPKTGASRKKKNVKIHVLSDFSDSSINNSSSDNSEASDSDVSSLRRNNKADKSPIATSVEDGMLDNIFYEAIDEASQNGTYNPNNQQSMVNNIIVFMKFISPDIVGVISNKQAPKLANQNQPSNDQDASLRNFFLQDNLVKLEQPKRQLIRDLLSNKLSSSSSQHSSTNRMNNMNLIKLFIFLFGNFCQDQQQTNENNPENGQKFNNLLDVFFKFMEYFYEYVNYQESLGSTQTNNDAQDSEQKSTNNNIKNVPKIEETLLTQSSINSTSDRSSNVKTDPFDLKEIESIYKHECELKTTIESKPKTDKEIATTSTTTTPTTTCTTSRPVNLTCANCYHPTTTSELNDFKTQISNRINTKLKHKCFEYQKEIERQNRIITDLKTKLSTETKSRELKIVNRINYEKFKNFYKLHNSKKGLETPTTHNNSSMNPYDDFESQLRSSSFQVE